MKKFDNKRATSIMIHAYFASSIILILVLLFGTLDPWLFSILGSASMHLSMAQVLFPDGNTILIIAMLWLMTFPVSLLVGYVLFLVKKWRIPFLAVMIADLVFVVAFCIWYYLTDNSYGGNFLLFDTLFNLAYVIVFIYMMRNKGAEMEHSGDNTHGTEDAEP